MNWVGGSRSRCVKHKEDEIKQRAFFQKQRMKRKSNIMDSPKVQNSGNMDLLTLFIVNQIASKKEQTGKPKINSLIGPKRTKKPLNEPLNLPMSPCSPSKLNLGISPLQNSVDTPVFKIRKHRLSEDLKFTPLSPVLESNLSDLSGSESQYQPSSTSAGSSDPIQPKPTTHVPSPLLSRENPDNMKNTPKYVSLPFSPPTNLNNPWTVAFNEAPEQDLPHNSPLVGIQFESTLPKPKMGEDLVTSVLYPPSSEQPEKPLFLDFKDCKVFDSMSSCDRSQNMDNAGHYSTQEFECTNSNTCADGRNVFMHVWESPRRVYLGQDDNIRSQITEEHQRVIGQEENGLRHAEDPLIAKHCCLSGNNLTATSSEAPSSKHEAKPYRDCQSETEAQRHDGSPPRTLNPAALNQTLTPTKLRSPKDGNKKRGKRPSSGASATNQKAQRHPKSQTGSFRKLHSEKSTKRDLTSILKPPFSKTSGINS